MATSKPEPPQENTPAEDRYMPGDPIPTAHATEADTDSVWALFSEVPKKPEPDFPETLRSPL